jgi:uncharacterized protein YcbX
MGEDGMRVSALAITPVKGLRISPRASLELGRNGIRGDRLLYLIDERGRMVNGKQCGELNQVVAELEGGRLTLGFPDGSKLTGELEQGVPMQSTIHSRPRSARAIAGPFSAALSEHCGRELRLVRAEDGGSAIDRGEDGAVSLISRASIAGVAESAGEGSIDARRFRMSIEVDGSEPFEEDRWVGRALQIGGAQVRVNGHVGRCLVTGRYPESGEPDVPMLDHLRAIRSGALTTEPLALGVHGAISQPGPVSVGDPVELL